MRTEQEMFDLLLTTAQHDERIRAVYLNGSRANPHIAKDMFQDFDIVYVVTETASFLEDDKWIHLFGDLLMVQEPDLLDKGLGLDKDFAYSYTYLMLFTDGNRIDLRLLSTQAMLDEYGKDKLTVPLLDKDQLLPPISPTSDCDYHISPPTKGQFDSCTNDFWWCLQNVAKGIWRDELPYAKQMFEDTTRHALHQMLNWWIGQQHHFELSTGKMGKYLKNYLPENYWALYKKTYADADYDHMWNAIFATCTLFRSIAKDVAHHFHFSYPHKDDANMTVYLKHVQMLPRDAKSIL